MSHARSTRLLCLSALLAQSLLLPLTSRAGAAADDQLRARLVSVQQTWTLNDPALKPWHMKVSFDLLDPKGAPTERGTLEQWWAAPDRFRWTVSSPSYTATLTRNGESLSRTAVAEPPPPLLYVLHRELLSAIPIRNPIDTAQLSVEHRNFGKAALDCIMLAPPRKPSDPAPPTFLFPTYCLDPDQPNLRISAATGGQIVMRNRLGRFQGKSIALDLSLYEDQNVALRATVDQLQTFTPTDRDFQSTPEQKSTSDSAVTTAPGVMAGHKLSGQPPHYPEDAKQAHISGAVILHALIGRDGHIYDLTPINSPIASLTYAAVAAVRTWTYRPYLLNGEPVEVETTITINFNIGR